MQNINLDNIDTPGYLIYLLLPHKSAAAYIGMTSDGVKREAQHLKTYGSESIFIHILLGFTEKMKARGVESELINRFPPHTLLNTDRSLVGPAHNIVNLSDWHTDRPRSSRKMLKRHRVPHAPCTWPLEPAGVVPYVLENENFPTLKKARPTFLPKLKLPLHNSQFLQGDRPQSLTDLVTTACEWLYRIHQLKNAHYGETDKLKDVQSSLETALSLWGYPVKRTYMLKLPHGFKADLKTLLKPAFTPLSGTKNFVVPKAYAALIAQRTRVVIRKAETPYSILFNGKCKATIHELLTSSSQTKCGCKHVKCLANSLSKPGQLQTCDNGQNLTM